MPRKPSSKPKPRDYRHGDKKALLRGEQLAVGKNESGKTAILEAIEGIKPFDKNMKYDKNIDCPRRHLNQYGERHRDSSAEVCVSEWKLDEGDVSSLEKEFGKNCLASKSIKVFSHYKGSAIWAIQLDEKNMENASGYEEFKSAFKKLDTIIEK